MKSRTTRRFRAALGTLPSQVQSQAKASYRQFRENPQYPGLEFKKVNSPLPLYSVRIGIHYRALGVRTGDEITWLWIGRHNEYERAIENL